MTQRFGKKIALDYSDYHEFSVPNSCDEAVMDYINNRVGVEIGRSKQKCPKGCLESKDLYILEVKVCP